MPASWDPSGYDLRTLAELRTAHQQSLPVLVFGGVHAVCEMATEYAHLYSLVPTYFNLENGLAGARSVLQVAQSSARSSNREALLVLTHFEALPDKEARTLPPLLYTYAQATLVGTTQRPAAWKPGVCFDLSDFAAPRKAIPVEL